MKRKIITDNSWFLIENSQTVGMLFDLGELFLLLKKNSYEHYDDLQQVEKKYGKLKTVSNESLLKKNESVGDYLTRHSDIKIIEDNHPFYTVGNSKIAYCAGYFALKFEGSKFYQVVHCPKQKTLEKYENFGPFKTRLEAQQEMKIQNTRLENNEL